MNKVCSLIYPGQTLKYITLSLIALFALLSQVFAHEIQPAVADLAFDGEGNYSVSIVLNLEAIMANIEPEVSDTSQSSNAPEYDRLRALEPEDLIKEFEDFKTSFLAKLNILVDDMPVEAGFSKVLVPEIGDLTFTRESVVKVEGSLPDGAATITWGWAREFGASIIRVSAETDEDPYSAYLVEGQQSEAIPIVGKLARSMLETIVNYISVGYVHIVP
ncbi:MAG TPA: hypothetical protein ENK61_06375, partial [Devosia sp.]|nr:hypothetical protein [Devosia sp.]